jgi:MFS family permease
MILFMVGSVVVAMIGKPAPYEELVGIDISPNIDWLIAARFFQAIGAGALVPVSIAMVGDLFPPDQRGVPFGLMGASAEAGGVIGPLWGGLITRYLDWTWVFWINIPLGIAVLVLIAMLLKPSPRFKARIDYIGGLLITLSIAALTLGLAGIDTPNIMMAVFLAAAVGSFALFIYRQRTTIAPLLPVSMFRSWAFRASNATHLLVGAALIIGMVTVPLMANTVQGMTPLDGGLQLMRMTAAIPVGAILGGLACQRFDYRVPTMAGLILAAAGFWFMSGWDMEIADPALTIHLVIAGFGFGLVIAPIALAATNSVEPGDRGTAAAIVTAMRMTGMTFGLAALAAWGTGRFSQLIAGIQSPLPMPNETQAEFQQRLQEVQSQLSDAGFTVFNEFFLVAMAICIAAIIPAVLMAWSKAREVV